MEGEKGEAAATGRSMIGTPLPPQEPAEEEQPPRAIGAEELAAEMPEAAAGWAWD